MSAVKRKPARRYTLRSLWKSADVQIVSSGYLIVYPSWRIPGDNPPGDLTRNAAERLLRGLIRDHLKGRK